MQDTKPFLQFERWCLTTLLAAAIGALVGTVWALLAAHPFAGKWCSTAGQLFALGALFQLEVSGFIAKLLGEYGDVDKYPFGPPSHVTRRLIDNPETPIRTRIANTLFHEPRTALWLAVLGTALQLVGGWL